MKKLLLPLFFSLIVISCATTGEVWTPEVMTLDEATIGKLSSRLGEGAYAAVIQDVNTLKREYPGVAGEDVGSLEIQAVSLLAENFRNAVDEEAWKEAFIYYSELETLEALSEIGESADESERWTKAALLRNEADALVESAPIPALVTFQKSLALETPNVEMLLTYGELAMEETYREVLRLIVLKMEEAAYEVPEAFIAGLAENGTPVEFMKGTVTIWVNRGIKLEDGMGYADRVIGSGFFIDKRGYLITNHHVIESEVDPEYSGFSRLYIRLPGQQGDKIPAEVIGWDPVFDIALLKTVMEPEYIFSFRNDQESVPGDKIYAIGSPGGLENTITSGIVSATGRRLLEVGDTIQVDVPINSGNSGGPLLNQSGELIGVVFAGIEQFEGVNFAIPSEWVSSRIPDFYEGGKQAIPWMGAALYEGNTGLELMYTYPDSPSERAGIKPGDKLLSLNGTPVESVGETQKLIMALDGQRIISAEWSRGEERFRTIIALENRPELPFEKALEIDSMERLILPIFGMELESSGRNNYVIKKVYPGMTAEETGLSVNDPLTVYEWEYDEELKAVLIQIRVKKRKAGFMESVVQLGAYVSLTNLI